MPSAVVGQAGAQGIQKTQSKATVETADTSNVPAAVKVRNCSDVQSLSLDPHKSLCVLIEPLLDGCHGVTCSGSR